MTPGVAEPRPAGARRSAGDRASWAWGAVAAALGVVALTGAGTDPAALDWQPGLALQAPWRAFTAVGVHYSGLHFAANLAGLLLTAAFGIAADVPPRAAVAWLGAWPLTQVGLLAVPALAHFGGLSGVLHAGVAVVAVWLLVHGGRRRRAIGAAVAVGCVAKIVGEAAWAPPLLRHPAGWDIATAPVAHLTGCVAGAACGLAAAFRPIASRGPAAHGR